MRWCFSTKPSSTEGLTDLERMGLMVDLQGVENQLEELRNEQLQYQTVIQQ